jgi:hypothetical protein
MGESRFVWYSVVSAGLQGPRASALLLLRVYLARKQMPGLVQRKWLKALVKNVGGEW